MKSSNKWGEKVNSSGSQLPFSGNRRDAQILIEDMLSLLFYKLKNRWYKLALNVQSLKSKANIFGDNAHV